MTGIITGKSECVDASCNTIDRRGHSREPGDQHEFKTRGQERVAQMVHPCLVTFRSSFAIKEPLPATPFMAGSGGGRIVVFRVCRDRSRVGSTAVFTLGLNGYPHLAALTLAERAAVIAATADGYPFPTNLDTDPPLGGLAPETQQALVARAVEAGWDQATLDAALETQTNKRRA